jgi:6,7-dimethyl-8-ribityllumazine synthase
MTVSSLASAARRSAASHAAHASQGRRYAFIHACWHADIVTQARDGFIQEMQRQGVPSDFIDVYEVPGAFELPLLAKKLAQGGLHAGIAACALVVDGGIYRHDFVASTVVDALMRVQLDTEVPVFSVVLTPHHFHEHEEHRSYYTRHFVLKGEEAARACLQTVKVLAEV